MNKKERRQLLVTAAVVGLATMAVSCGSSQEGNWQVATPVGVVAAEGDPPPNLPVKPQEKVDEWVLIKTATPLPTPTATFAQTATLVPTRIPEPTETSTLTEILRLPTFTSILGPLPTETPIPIPTPTQTATVVGPSEWPRGEPQATPRRELMPVPTPSEDLTNQQWGLLNDSTVIADFGWGYCSGASIDPAGIVKNKEGVILVADHCTKNVVGQRLPPPIIGHPAYRWFETRYLGNYPLLDAAVLAYNTRDGGIAFLRAGDPLQVEPGDTLFTVTYQFDTLNNRGFYEAHHVRITALEVTNDEIIFADGVDPKADWPYVTSGASSSWLAQVQEDGELRGIGIITAGGDREADPDAYDAYVRFLGYKPGAENLGFATRVDMILKELKKGR